MGDAGAGCVPSRVGMRCSGCVSSEAGGAGDRRAAMAGPPTEFISLGYETFLSVTIP